MPLFEEIITSIQANHNQSSVKCRVSDEYMVHGAIHTAHMSENFYFLELSYKREPYEAQVCEAMGQHQYKGSEDHKQHANDVALQC